MTQDSLRHNFSLTNEICYCSSCCLDWGKKDFQMCLPSATDRIAMFYGFEVATVKYTLMLLLFAPQLLNCIQPL